MKVIAIDTSNQTLSVALCDNDKLIGQYTGTTNKNHSISLMPAIDFVMKENKVSPQDLERIVVAQGPGSYTGLRIGVTTGKTLAWTLGIELVGVSSLATLAANSKDFNGYIVPLFDARRNNVYTGAYQWQTGQLVNVIADQHISLAEWLVRLIATEKEIRFVGNDVAKFHEFILAEFPAKAIGQGAQINEVNSYSLALLGQQLPAVQLIEAFVPSYLKLVEAEENWLANNHEQRENYVEKI